MNGFNTIWVKDELSFEDLKRQCWSGAIDTLRIIEEHKKEDLFMDILSDIFGNDYPTLTTVNDFLWFDTEYLLCIECVGCEVVANG